MTADELESFAARVFAESAATKQAAGAALASAIASAARVVADAYANGGIAYVFGNGGSAADAQHFAGELVGRYHRTRKPLAAVALSTDPSAITCIANDFGYDDVFARQVEALVTARDVVIGITTSGKSPNVVNGLAAARRAGAKTIALSGGDGGPVVAGVDVAIVVPSTYTPRIQECHTTAIHAMSELVEHLALGLPLP